MLPLDGFRVLDLTRFLSGPYCTMVLAELGADVIKVEQPHTGDDSRRLAPKVNDESYPFAMPNRSKRSISLDLKADRGRELFLHLARDADLVIENFRPGVVRRLGIDYAAVKAVRPDVLYCSISGFGQSGPYRDRPGFDIMAQGATGLMRMTGEPGGRPAWGHSGGLPGFSTLLVHLPDEGLTVVAMANETGADVAALVERTVRRVIEAGRESGTAGGGSSGRKG